VLLAEKVDTNKTAMNFMRTFYRLALGLLWIAFAAPTNTVATQPATNDWAVVELQANSQVWQRTTLETGPSGALFPRTQPLRSDGGNAALASCGSRKGIVGARRTTQRL